ncbi:MAG: hypothetical protein RIM99_02770 [Cyclobacteriaceae bacterium]
MLRQAIALLLFIPQLVFSQTSDLPFQVLIAENATIFGNKVEPLTYVDDVTNIEVGENGFVALVHKGGTTFELKEKTFTFYLKKEKLKDQANRPDLTVLYEDSARVDDTKIIKVLHPVFDAAGTISWKSDEPFEMYWHLPDEPVISYKVTVSDHTGKKIQDFGTRNHSFILKPYDFGLEENLFIFQISSTFAGETIKSKRYNIELEEAPSYPIKASDLVLKALNLELSPVSALDAWKEVLGAENGKFYFGLFEKFIARNMVKLTDSAEDIELLLSQNK